MRSTDLSACTAEAANDVMDSFNFSSKAYLFDEVIPMPMKAEVTASCNPKLGDRLFSSKLKYYVEGFNQAETDINCLKNFLETFYFVD